MKDDLTTAQVADFLHVSHPYLPDLIKSGAPPTRFMGAEQRVAMEDLARYKEQVNAQCRKALDELIAESQELGLGY